MDGNVFENYYRLNHMKTLELEGSYLIKICSGKDCTRELHLYNDTENYIFKSGKLYEFKGRKLHWDNCLGWMLKK